MACCNANSACVKILLNHGARVNCFDKQKLAAPLFCAVASGGGNESETVVDLLLSAGADINLGKVTLTHYFLMNFNYNSFQAYTSLVFLHFMLPSVPML